MKLERPPALGDFRVAFRMPEDLDPGAAAGRALDPEAFAQVLVVGAEMESRPATGFAFSNHGLLLLLGFSLIDELCKLPLKRRSVKTQIAVDGIYVNS